MKNKRDTRTQSWSRAVVLQVLDEMVQIRPEEMSEKYTEWVETDGDKLALEGTNVREREASKSKESAKHFEDSDDSPMRDSGDDIDEDMHN